MMSLLLVMVALAEPVPPPDAPVSAPADPAALQRATGAAALAAKHGEAAHAAYTACLQLLPDDLDCRWQRGWASWLTFDWEGAVADWAVVEAANPKWPGLASPLAQARAQRALMQTARAARAAAPVTVVSTAPAGTTVRLRAVGDMMIGTDFPAGYLPPDAGAGTFDAVGAALRDADFTFGNLEGPLCDTVEPSVKCRPDAAPGSCYAFRTPTSYARWYQQAGFDVVSTANNHAADFGEECRVQTETALSAQGIRYSGRPGTVAEWTVNGVKVALIGFHTNPSSHYLNDLPIAVGLVQALVAHNDVVIVSFHGGAEGSKAIHVPVGPEKFYGEDRGDLRVFTHAVVDAGADLVLGHGPHVLRGMETYKGRLIAYSLGNFATYGRFNLSANQGVGVILDVTLGADGRLVAAKLLGTRQEGEGRPVPDPANTAADLVRTLSASDFPEYGVRVAQDGSIVVAAP